LLICCRLNHRRARHSEENAMKSVLGALTCIALLLTPAAATAAAPGTLSAANPVVDTPPGAQAWRIRYWTTSDRGKPIEVTGMVVAPREEIPATPRPVIAWAHGTSGVVQRCAPSLDTDFFGVTPGAFEAIQRGFVVVAPDYPGLGSPMPHDYLGGISTANAVLDAVRAARNIPGAAAGARFVVWGESQGGHAALWTGQRARSYAPDLALVGPISAPAAIPRFVPS
jgi:alpha-beta hydrolase superfamily lysophospholipase